MQQFSLLLQGFQNPCHLALVWPHMDGGGITGATMEQKRHWSALILLLLLLQLISTNNALAAKTDVISSTSSVLHILILLFSTFENKKNLLKILSSFSQRLEEAQKEAPNSLL